MPATNLTVSLITFIQRSWKLLVGSSMRPANEAQEPVISRERLQAFSLGTDHATNEELALFEALYPGRRKVSDSFIWDMLEGRPLPHKTIDLASFRILADDPWDRLESLAASLYRAAQGSDTTKALRYRISIEELLKEEHFAQNGIYEELADRFRNWSLSRAQRSNPVSSIPARLRDRSRF